MAKYNSLKASHSHMGWRWSMQKAAKEVIPIQECMVLKEARKENIRNSYRVEQPMITVMVMTGHDRS